MSPDAFWLLLQTIGLWPTFAYLMLMDIFPDRSKHIRAPIKPFIRMGTAPLNLVSIVHEFIFGIDQWWGKAFGALIFLAWIQIWLRIWFDNVDDDWWKKKRKKAAAKIKQLAGRLVVVPT